MVYITQKVYDMLMDHFKTYNEFLLESLNPPYLYHGTKGIRLPNILKTGLGSGQRDTDTFYVTSSLEDAEYYSNRKDKGKSTILRFKNNGKFKEVKGKINEYSTEEIINPDEIEIKVNNDWIRLIDYMISDHLLENQINIVKTLKIPVKRYYTDENNKFTNKLRGGTYFSYVNDEKANRYNQHKYKLGGNKLIEGCVTYKNPLILITSNSYVLSDFQIFSTMNIFTKKDLDILYESVDYDKKELIKLYEKEISNDKDNIKILKGLTDFGIANIIADNILSNRMKEMKSHDIFIRLDEDYNIFEIFDVFNKFKEIK